MSEIDLIVKDKKTLWQDRMADWKKSGLTQPAFCQQQNITLSSFGYWRKRLKKCSLSSEDTSLKFFPVSISKEKNSGLTLNINADYSIEVQPGFNKNLLIDIIQTIQSI